MTDSNGGEMLFLEHLEELRWRIIKSLASIIVGAILTFLVIDDVLRLLVQPTLEVDPPMDLQVLKVQGMFMLRWGVAIFGGLVVALPVLTYQIWKFIVPGLYPHEKRWVAPVIIFTYGSFLTGVFFAYFIIIPFSLNFFSSMGTGTIDNNISINYYMSFVMWLMFGTGLIFELPMMSFILSLVGLITPRFLRKYRRHSLVMILLVSAFITPPDPASMVIMAIPLVALYEISIGVSFLVLKNKKRKELKAHRESENA